MMSIIADRIPHVVGPRIGLSVARRYRRQLSIAVWWTGLAVALPVAGRAAPPGGKGNLGSSADLAGRWAGRVQIIAPLNVEFFASFSQRQGVAGCCGTVDFPTLGIAGIPLSGIAYTPMQLSFTLIPPLPTGFEGAWQAQSNAFVGTWRLGGQVVAASMRRCRPDTPIPGGPPRPQTPRPPYPYEVREVAYHSPVDGVLLAGSLTLPAGEVRHPAVLMITGAFPQDRDENILGHRLFLVIADYLSRRGVAVLRVDDRGMGDSGGAFFASTYDQFVADAQAGIAWLKTCPQIDGERIGVIGHSEGGMIAAAVAARSPEVSFLVMLASPAMPIRELVPITLRHRLPLVGWQGERIERCAARASDVMDMLAGGRDRGEIRAALGGELFDDMILAFSDTIFAPLPTPLRMFMQASDTEGRAAILLPAMETPYIRCFVGHDPGPDLRKLRCPIFAVYGTRDTLVPAENNIAALKKALGDSALHKLTLARISGINHLMQTVLVADSPDVFLNPQTIAPELLEAVSNWISKQTALTGSQEPHVGHP